MRRRPRVVRSLCTPKYPLSNVNIQNVRKKSFFLFFRRVYNVASNVASFVNNELKRIGKEVAPV